MDKNRRNFFQNSLIMLSFAAGAAGQLCFYCFKLAVPGMLFFAAAITLVIIHGRAPEKEAALNITKKTEIILLSIIVVIAAFLRLAMIDTIPAACFNDEAQNINAAKSIMDSNSFGGVFLPVYITGHTHNTTAFIYMAAALFRALGSGPVQMRIVAAVTGILAVPAFYFLIRYVMGPGMALAGAFLLAVMRWHINFSRIGFHGILSVTILILTAYFTARAYKERKTGDITLAGLTAALSLYSYQSARLVIVWLGFLAAYAFFKDRDFFRQGRNGLFAALVLGYIALTPLGMYAVKHPGDLFMRQGQVFVLDKNVVQTFWSAKQTVAGAFGETILNTAGMFNMTGDNNARHNLPGAPMLDFFTGMAALIGFGYSLYRIREPVYFFFISFFIAFISTGLFTIESPHSLRTIDVIPAVIFFALVYLNRLAGSFKGRPLLAVTALTVILAAAGAENTYIYFGPQAHSALCRRAFSLDEYEAGLYLKNTGKGRHRIVYANLLENDTFRLMAGDMADGCEIFDINNAVPDAQEAGEDTVYIVPDGQVHFDPLIRAVYPHAEAWLGTDAFSGSDYLFKGITVPKQDVVNWNNEKRKHGLTVSYYEGLKPGGEPVLTGKKKLIAFGSEGLPAAPPLSAVWSGKIRIEAGGRYGFILHNHNYTALAIDGRNIIEGHGPRAQGVETGTAQGEMILGAGLHSIKLEQSIMDDHDSLYLMWLQPGAIQPELVPPTAFYY